MGIAEREKKGLDVTRVSGRELRRMVSTPAHPSERLQKAIANRRRDRKVS
jgi:hypothetical protein